MTTRIGSVPKQMPDAGAEWPLRYQWGASDEAEYLARKYLLPPALALLGAVFLLLGQ